MLKPLNIQYRQAPSIPKNNANLGDKSNFLKFDHVIEIISTFMSPNMFTMEYIP